MCVCFRLVYLFGVGGVAKEGGMGEIVYPFYSPLRRSLAWCLLYISKIGLLRLAAGLLRGVAVRHGEPQPSFHGEVEFGEGIIIRRTSVHKGPWF